MGKMNLTERDLNVNWHPCSQMKDYEKLPALEVDRAEGSYIYLKDGKKILDAISSWWCKSLGHNHPRLKEALIKQAERFEHVIYANTTNDTIVELSEKLISKTRNMSKAFYAGDGSTAVEIALKMSLHYRKINGDKRNKLAALKNGYHGESTLCLSVSDLGIYNDAYRDWMLPVTFLGPIPYRSGSDDENWMNAEAEWKQIEKQLEPIKDELTAVIFEPIVQGAGGMMVYCPDLLKRLKQWADQNNVHLIADEIMTGFSRTGEFLGIDHANIDVDFICLSKGLTSGFLAFSSVLTTQKIYDVFYDDYKTGKSFLHSNTYSGNALGASVALELMKIYDEEDLSLKANRLETFMRMKVEKISEETSLIKNIRACGAMVAFDLDINKKRENERLGFEIFKKAIALGALLRPLGNTIYWFPPLNSSFDEINKLAKITETALVKTLK
jgi:adenosylmethionine---8-amino-7-oxononanoate aminotransferase